MRTPKPKNKITPEQEKQIAQSERLHIRAEIFTLGVAELLKRGEYCGIDALEESSRVLKDAHGLRTEAYRIKNEATKHMDDGRYLNTVRRRK